MSVLILSECVTLRLPLAGENDYIIATTSLLTGQRVIEQMEQRIAGVSLNPF